MLKTFAFYHILKGTKSFALIFVFCFALWLDQWFSIFSRSDPFCNPMLT